MAEIGSDGQVVITKENNSGGIMTTGTVTAQLLYEIQGPLYYNSDVTANIENVQLVQESPDRVRLLGVEGLPPPPTTKVGVSARGGWQAEFHFFLTGLDVKEKAEMVQRQTLESMGDYRKEFTTLKFTITGSVSDSPRNQDAATVDLRIFAQTRNPDVVSAGTNKGISPDQPTFAKWVRKFPSYISDGASDRLSNRSLADLSGHSVSRIVYRDTQGVHQQLICVKLSVNRTMSMYFEWPLSFRLID